MFPLRFKENVMCQENIEMTRVVVCIPNMQKNPEMTCKYRGCLSTSKRTFKSTNLSLSNYKKNLGK